MSERHELLAAVRARLQRVAAGQDLSPVLEPEAMTETRQLAGVLADDEGDRTEAQDDLAAALSVFAEAAQVGSAAPLTRIEAARHAAALAAPTDPGRAAGLLEAAVLLLPEVAPRQLRRGDQQYAIGRLAGLAGDAAALALADPAGTSRQRARRALRLLEAGRAVLLSQALDTRSDLTDLRQRHPDLATRFTDLRDRIDTGPADETVPPEPDSDTNAARWWDRLAQERRSLAGQMGATLARIRAQDGFASFALPGAPWPRVWWATGGLLGPLPLHAAGYHSPGPDAEPRTVMDRVVSSYTPTIRALRYARQHTPPPAAGVPDTAGQALIVAMPVTPGLPGQGRLPGVPAEIAMLRALLNQPVLLTEPDPGPGAPVDDAAAEHVPTRASVLARLPAAAIAHFACHGSTDPADPSQSRLLLHDHDAAPLTVASLAPVNLDHAQLAYLSACNTTVTRTTELLDEAIHLTSAFQLAGFPHVIGTLWAISDQLAVAIAATFYTHLRTREDTLNTSHAAHALHHAIHVARDSYPAAPSLWAAYLHAGS